MRSIKHLGFVLSFVLSAAGVARAAAPATAPATAQLVVRADHENGIYKTGEKITWTITLKDGSPDDVKDARYRVMLGQLTEASKGALDLASGSATVDTTVAEPCATLLIIDATVKGKKVRALGGAIADPYAIKTSAPPPDDFSAFWEGKIKDLRAIPMNEQVEASDSGDPKVDYALVTLDNINGTHVYGQIAKPTGDGKFPAMLEVQYAGVYPLGKDLVTKRAAQGWLALDIMAHDIPIGKDKAYYDELGKGKLKGYTAIGETDRDQSYFLRMYLGCVRAVDYLAQRPDWNGKVLIVTGASQGGEQALITGGLCPQVTGVFACVPAGCDVTGKTAGRMTGFPYYANRATETKNPKVIEVGRYFDCCNFTPRIKCPTLVGTGLIDETCPATGVCAAFDEITAPKQLIIFPLATHTGVAQQMAFSKKSWAVWDDLIKGKPMSLDAAK